MASVSNAPRVCLPRRAFLLLLGVIAAIPVCAQTGTPEPQIHTIPFTLRDNKILIQAKVNGISALLKLDSGSTNTVFDAKFLKVPASTRVEVRTASGLVEASRGDARCEIGDIAFVLPNTVYLPNFAGQGLIGSEGVIGIDVLSKFKRVVIDFTKLEIELTD